MTIGHIMKEASLETFDQVLNDGTLGKMSVKARDLVENNPGLTVRELLKIGVKEKIYSREDRNLIAPRITKLFQDGIIVRPTNRICTVSGEPAATHEMAPESWRVHRNSLFTTHKGPYVKNRLEIESKTKPDVIHTCIEWTDGSVSCTCDKLYHRTLIPRCHHVIGMIKAITGRNPGEPDWKTKYEELKLKYEKLERSIEEFRELYSK